MKLWRTPLDVDKFFVPHGTVRIIKARCKGCRLCIRYCPREVLGTSEAKNKKGYHLPQVVQPERCTACRLCELLCPEFAIFVAEVEESSDQQSS